MGILNDLRHGLGQNADVQRMTWITHALGAVGFSLLTHFMWGQLVAGAWVAVVFFVIKEQLDKRMHLRRGDYDTPDASGVAARSDHIGDLLGPICDAVGMTVAAWLT